MSAYDILDLFYPARCVCCGALLPFGKKGACPGCYEKLSFVTPPVCLGCGKEMEDRSRFGMEEYCRDCLRYPKDYAYGIPLLNYNEMAKTIMTGLKYENKRENARFLAQEIARRKGKQIKGIGEALLVPVPVHPRKRRSRGFNQAGLIARQLGSLLDIPVREDVLFRVQETAAQKKLGYEQRQKNEKRAFCAKGKISGTVILVDDIYTTGATAQACTRVLLKAGATKVILVNGAIGYSR